MSESIKDRVFISYASENISVVTQISKGLNDRKLNVWFDKNDLKPGKWKPQIKKAIAQSRYFLICISNAALIKTGPDIGKVGFQDEELTYAYDIAQNQTDRNFTIIPVRLEDCGRGDHRISCFQQYDLLDDFESGLDHLAVDLGGISIGSDLPKIQRSEKEEIIEKLLGKSFAAYYARDFDKSLNIIDCVLDLQERDDRAWSHKGACLSALGNNEEALLAFQKAIDLVPDVATYWYNKGLTLVDQKKTNEALQSFEKAIEINPQFKEALIDAGLTLLAVGRYEEAVAACDRAQKIDSNYYRSWSCKGVIQYQQGHYEKSISLFEKAIKLSAPFYDPRDLFNKGQALLKLDKLEKAYHAFDIASKMMADFVECLFNKGAVLAKLNRNQEAHDTFFKIVKIQHDFPGVWSNMALTLLKLKRYTESAEAYEKAVLHEPNDKVIWHNKACAHHELGQTDKAMVCCEKALKIDSKFKNALILKKRILINTHR